MPIKRDRDKKSKIMWTTTLAQNNGSAAGMKFRPPKETPREETKGKLPCAEATSVQQVNNHQIIINKVNTGARNPIK